MRGWYHKSAEFLCEKTSIFVTGSFSLPVFFLWPLHPGDTTAHFESPGTSLSHIDIHLTSKTGRLKKKKKNSFPQHGTPLNTLSNGDDVRLLNRYFLIPFLKVILNIHKNILKQKGHMQVFNELDENIRRPDDHEMNAEETFR